MGGSLVELVWGRWGGVRVVFWFSLEVNVLTVAVGDGQRKSQFVLYCMRNYY